MNAIASGFKGFTAYLKGVMGADAYSKYLEHHEATCDAGPPLTERQFWRDRMDRQDASPQGRCC